MICVNNGSSESSNSVILAISCFNCAAWAAASAALASAFGVSAPPV